MQCVLLLSGVALCKSEELEAGSPLLPDGVTPETSGVDVRTLSHILPSLYSLGRYQPSYGYTIYNRPSYVNTYAYSALNRPATPYVIALQQPLPYVYNRPAFTAYSGASGSSSGSSAPAPLFSGYNNNGYALYPYGQPYGYGIGYRQGASNHQDVSTTLSVEPISNDPVKF